MRVIRIEDSVPLYLDDFPSDGALDLALLKSLSQVLVGDRGVGLGGLNCLFPSYSLIFHGF